MAFTEFCCRSGGSNLNAGTRTGNSTEPGAAADLTYAGGSYVQSTRVFTVASGNPVSDGVAVNDFAALDTGGATAAYVARVSARTTTTITLVVSGFGTNPADGTYTLRIGGAWKGPNAAENFPVSFVSSALAGGLDASGNFPRINLKNTATYSITASISSSLPDVLLEGYATAYGDGGMATIDGGTSGASYVLLSFVTNASFAKNLILQNNGATGSAAGLSVNTANVMLESVVVHDVRGHGFSFSATCACTRCEAYACNQSTSANIGGFTTTEEMSFDSCISHDNLGTAAGFHTTSASTEPTVYTNCIADSNGGDGFRAGASAFLRFKNCNARANTGDGIDVTVVGSSYIIIENCLLTSNGGYGINAAAALPYCRLINNAFYDNTSGQTNNVNATLITGSVTLSGNPFIDDANGDFDLNNTAGAGAACRGAGIGTFTQTVETGTLGYPDIGAVQHQDTGGASAMMRPVGLTGGLV